VRGRTTRLEQYHEPAHGLPEETRTGRETARPALADLTTCLKSEETTIPATCEPCPFGFGTRIVVPTLTDGACLDIEALICS
jgi:hypothetical protein